MNLAGIVLRAATPEDHAFILATWVKSRLAGIPSRRRRRAAKVVHGEAEARLRACGAIVACSADHPSTLHGWASGECGVLHYAYVPLDLRGHGLGRALIQACQRDRSGAAAA